MSFGDLPLLSDSVHTASLVSRSRVQLLIIDRQDFNEIFSNSSKAKHKSSSALPHKSTNQESIDFLSRIPLFKDWPLHLLEHNPHALKTCAYARNQIISKDTHSTKHVYIIKRGYVSIWTRLVNSTKQQQQRQTIVSNCYNKTLDIDEQRC